MKKIATLSISILLLANCSSNYNKEETLAQAYKIHLEAIAIKSTVDSILIYEGGKKFEMALADSINVLATEWEKGLVEVPGFEANDVHQHNQSKKSPNMTEKELLDYQILSKKAIQEILNNLEKLSGK